MLDYFLIGYDWYRLFAVFLPSRYRLFIVL